MPLRGSQGPKEKLRLVGMSLLVPSESCPRTGAQALRLRRTLSLALGQAKKATSPFLSPRSLIYAKRLKRRGNQASTWP